MSKEIEISDKYKRVVDEWLINGGNKARAWMKISPDCKALAAGTISFDRMLKNAKVKEYLENQQKALAEQADIEKTRIINFMYAALCADPLDYVSEGVAMVGKNGINIVGSKFKALEDIPKEIRLLIKKYEIDGDGVIKMELFSKEKAVETLNRMLGFNQADAKNDSDKPKTPDEIRARLKELNKIEKELDSKD